VLDVARRGIYPAAHLRDVDAATLGRFFEPIENGKRHQHYQVADEVRNMVRFQCHNLLDDLPGPIFDIIFCRNVTIYFDFETTRRVARNLYDRLRPGGYLFLGHAESYYNVLPEMTIVQFGDVLVNRKPIR
jgi:chemotaxis protein methyltransferase CheR